MYFSQFRICPPPFFNPGEIKFERKKPKQNKKLDQISG